MITPRFKLTQEDGYLTINIRAPYCCLGQLDVIAEEENFIFACKPYYLRLQLPGELVADNRMKSNFDTDSGEFNFTYPKKNPEEEFQDLDLITKFLIPKVDAVTNHGSIPIEVISPEATTEIHQQHSTPNSNIEYGYGFALRCHKDFLGVSSEFDDVFEINPRKVPLDERRKLKLQYEQGKFDPDHYIGDALDTSEILEIRTRPCPYVNARNNPDFCFTNKDMDFLKNQPNIQYDLCLERISYCHNGLLDILFAYCYDRRTTYFEGSVESGWTITKLAASLCWHDAFRHPKDVLISAFRRSLIYPLYRNFDLSQRVFQDLKELISLEEKYIIKELLNIYDVFLHGDYGRFVLNSLFIKDYIIYVMKWDPLLWQATVKTVMDIEMNKEELGLNLNELEAGQMPFTNLRPITYYELLSDSDDSDFDTSDDSSCDSSSSESSTEYDDGEGAQGSCE